MAHETPSIDRRRRRPLVVWGAALLVLGLLGGVGGGAGLVAQIGSDLVRAFGAEPEATPVEMEVDLHEGTYLVYELTGASRSVGPVTTTNSSGVTVTVSDVTVTAPDGSVVPVESPRFDETLDRGSSTYTGAVSFETESEGRYRISVSTPATQVIVAPSVASMFTNSLAWLALLGLSSMVLLVGLVLLVVGLVRGRPAGTPAVATPSPAQQPTVAAAPAGWYDDPYGQAAQRWWDGQAWTEHLH